MSAGNEEFTAEFFDESSKAWNSNKVRNGHQMAYKCMTLCKTGSACKNLALTHVDHCRIHKPVVPKTAKAELKAKKDS